MLELCPKLNSKDQTPIYLQLYKYIKEEILSGNMPPESKLPSIRSLAIALKLSKNTIEAAYEQLVAEGYVKPRNRSGLYVEKIEIGFTAPISTPCNEYEQEKDKNHDYSIKYDFRSGLIDLEAFPYNQFRKILGRSVDIYSKELLLYGNHKGDQGLREEIAKYLHSSRGVKCSAKQILISSGTQQALTLLSLIISKMHRHIAFEEPGYLGARAVFNDFNYKVMPIPLEENGIDIKALKKSRAKVVYVTPSHQFPYGMMMTISKRLSLLKWAKEKEGIIIEDDYDGEFRYKGKPTPSLQGLDESGRVVYLGSFSKSLMTSMRISYLVLPETLLTIYETNYTIYEQTVSRLLQKALEIFIKEGYWEKHLRKARVLYKKKQEILLEAIRKYFGQKATVMGADSGLHILLEVNTKIKEAELIARAFKAGVKVNPTSIYWIKPMVGALPVILIGFAGIKLENIADGIKILSEICQQV